jgi:MYXO-CTERM domain-containing protein
MAMLMKILCGMMVVVVLVMASAALAGPELLYDGSFQLPTGEPGWTAENICFVPAGNTRPGSGQTVTGPTLLVGWETRSGYSDGGIREITIPALVTSGTMNRASWIAGASGGTSMGGIGGQNTRMTGPYDVDAAGSLWGPGGSGVRGLRSGSTWELGSTTNTTPALAETWYGPAGMIDYGTAGVLRRGDGAGNDLSIADGTLGGTRFLITTRGNGGSYDTKVYENIRNGDGGNMTGSLLFSPRSAQTNYGGAPAWASGRFDLQYVRDPVGQEWFVLMNVPWNGKTAGVIDFYRSDVADGQAHDPELSPDIDLLARDNGVGEMGSGNYQGIFEDIAVDWANSKLYVLESNGYAKNGGNNSSRVHVFTLFDEVPPVPEPAGLGVVGLALLGLKRRRA